MLNCEVIELDHVPAEWKDMFTGPENVFTIRTVDVLLETDEQRMVESIRFCRITNLMAIEITTHRGRGGNVYVFNRNRLVDPLVWDVEDPKEFIQDLCEDMGRRNDVLGSPTHEAIEAEEFVGE